jgi:hypothetical protein
MKIQNPVFVHWQYIKDRWVWCPMKGAEGQDYFANVLHGRYGEDALALAFFSHVRSYTFFGVGKFWRLFVRHP